MQRGGATEFTDPDNYQVSIGGAKFDFVFSCQKGFEARLTWVELRNSRLLRCQETLARIAHIKLNSDSVFVAFPTWHSSPPIFNGVEVRPGEIVFHSSGERLHQRTVGPSRWGLISVATQSLAACGKALNGYDLVAPPVPRILRPSRLDVVRLLGLHASACHIAETNPQMIAHPEVARAIEHDLLHALVNCLTNSNAYDYSARKRHHMEIIARLEDVSAANFERSLKMSELCMVIGASERTLRTCCTEFLGMGPSRYLRLKRLNMVRASLRRVDSAKTTVADLASSYGFHELGRFATIYRTMFGETPSTTLQSARFTPT
jgi:AraC-like DNA-binding protein